MALQFFLGANSREGFVTLYPQLIGEAPRRIFSIKSGPGSGKSTAIRYFAQALDGAEEEILCSSDPDSLDGAIFPELAILDGTAPHVLEPETPGAWGDYLTLPPYLDRAGLEEKYAALLEKKAACGRCYAQAYRLLAAAGLAMDVRRQLLLPSSNAERLASRGRSLICRCTAKKAGKGQLRLRFLEGYTPRGKLFLSQTVSACAGTIYALRDSFGLGEPFLIAAREAALERGQLVYACMDPLVPKRLRHLLLPEAGVAILTKYDETLPLDISRSVHLDSMLPKELLRRSRGKLRLLERTAQSLEQDALQCIKEAHLLHDEMEALYRPHLNLTEMEAHLSRQLALLRR